MLGLYVENDLVSLARRLEGYFNLSNCPSVSHSLTQTASRTPQAAIPASSFLHHIEEFLGLSWQWMSKRILEV